MERPARILLAKIGLDGHDVGVKIVARALRDAGFEVIYTGLRQPVEAVARTAAAEDVDAVGVSILSGAHVGLTRRLVAALAGAGLPGVPVLVGGFIPRQDVERLREAGAAAVFPAGEPLDRVVAHVREALDRAAASEERR
jgi:methylmalonyl-CoA mutase C-terminal domain/subunit